MGSGCPSGSTVDLLSPDGATLTVTFSQFEVELAADPAKGPGSAATTCTVRIPITVPEGYAWAASRTTYRGFAEMDDGMRALRSSTYSLRRQLAHKMNEIDPAGDGSWEATDEVSPVWSGCGTTTDLVIATTLRLDAPPGLASPVSGVVLLDTMDNTTVSSPRPTASAGRAPGMKKFMKIGLAFKPCERPAPQSRA